jgi:hypothetical protein
MDLPLLFATVKYLHTEHCNTNCLPRTLIKVTEFKFLKIMRGQCIEKLKLTEVVLPPTQTRNDFPHIKLGGGGSGGKCSMYEYYRLH